ncbi:MAG: chorismate synthase [Bacteroidales bacterium]|nr:chorismate synthase [Bacteroidales bacterium]
MYNSIGNTLRLTTFGESHGTAIGGILDGCTANIPIDEQLLRSDIQRRQVGDTLYGVSFEQFATPRHEPDNVTFLSGILDGTTLGTPIAFVINNSDTNGADYNVLQSLYRPLHADRTWEQRFGRRDPRGGGRASARETVARVVAGVVAKSILKTHDINVIATVKSLAGIEISNNATALQASQILADIQQKGDTAGGTITCTVEGMPAGIGNPTFDRLQSRLAYALMSIPTVRAFEFGQGSSAPNLTGSEYIAYSQEHTDGIIGGISDGNPVTIRLALHPVGTIAQGTPCLDRDGNTHVVKPQGRHDTCHVPRTAVIVEAMTALTIADLMITQ